MSLPAVDRRTLLVGGGVGVGLVLGFLAWPRQVGSPLRAGAKDRVFGSYLRIGADGAVSVAVPQVETGQGAWTALAQIAADELGADWNLVAVEPAPLGSDYVNRVAAREYGVVTRFTGGGTTVRAFEAPIRIAAAAARDMLCRVAAARWNVSASECDAESGFVIHEQKRLAFGDLAIDAARLDPPNEPELRPTGEGRLMGSEASRLDLPGKIDGGFRFAGDVRLPRMLFASARLAPPGGKLLGHQPVPRSDVRLIAHDDWIAAVAPNWWQAERTLAAALPTFSGPENGNGAAVMSRLADALTGEAGATQIEHGDYAGAVEGSRPLAATYTLAPLPHRSLEPASAAARIEQGRLEIWSGSVVPDFARARVAAAIGYDPGAVTLYPMPVGDQSGGAMQVEVGAIAAVLAKETGQPINLTLSPATTQTNDFVRPPMIVTLSALPSPSGTIATWHVRAAGVAGVEGALAGAAGKTAPAFKLRGAFPPYGIPAIRIDAADAGPLNIRTGFYRGGDEAMMTFATESFIDEMGRAMGIDPLAIRMTMLGGSPRLAKALATATAIGGWDGGGRGSLMGLACASLQGSHIALVVQASVGANRQIEVARMTAAVDCGRIVNPSLVRQQVEGALIQALADAQLPSPNFVAGQLKAEPMRGRPFERLASVPKIEIELIESKEAPGGVSGLGTAVLAPAIANAIAAGTGRRLRNLPFDLMAS